MCMSVCVCVEKIEKLSNPKVINLLGRKVDIKMFWF